MTPAEQFQFVVDSLRLLAAPAGDQLRALPSFVVATDEIVSTLGDAMLLVPQLERAGRIGAVGSDALRCIGAWLDSMPVDGSLTDPSTLRTHEFWDVGRALARSALLAVNEEVRMPELHQTTWVRAGK